KRRRQSRRRPAKSVGALTAVARSTRAPTTPAGPVLAARRRASADQLRRADYDRRPMRAIVTGGAGFIGSHVADALIARGDEVHVVDNLATGSRENLPSAAELHELDIRDEALGELVGR